MSRYGATTQGATAVPFLWTSPGSTYPAKGGSFFNGDWHLSDRPGGDTNDGTLCYYRPANITVDGSTGFIALEGRSETINGHYDDGTAQTRNFTSGQMFMAKHSWLYGTYEIRCRLTSANGINSAIWTVGTNCQGTFPRFEDNGTNAGVVCNWPSPGSDEIDIVEVLNGVGLNNPTDINFQIHSGANNDGTTVTPGFDLSAAMHTYKFVWSPSSMQLFVDGTLGGTISAHIPSTPMFNIIQVALGPGGATIGATLPQRMLIDYVRITP